MLLCSCLAKSTNVTLSNLLINRSANEYENKPVVNDRNYVSNHNSHRNNLFLFNCHRFQDVMFSSQFCLSLNMRISASSLLATWEITMTKEGFFLVLVLPIKKTELTLAFNFPSIRETSIRVSEKTKWEEKP